MGGEDAAAFSSNAASYAQHKVTQEQLRATQEELSSKIRELQIYETNFIQQKRELTRWKKKFEYIFRENELLSLETAKLDASHKQIAFLQQEIKFKEEEGNALRGLVSALEASNKKARVSRLDSAARLAGKKDLPEAALAGAALLKKENGENTVSAANSVAPSEGADANAEALEKERKERIEERERYLAEISALKSENSMLLKDLDRKELALQLREEKVAAHKERIESLEQSLKEEQDKHLEQLREKQDKIVDLEIQIQQMEMRRRSSAAYFARDNDDDGGIGFGPTHRLKDQASTGDDDAPKDEEDPDFDENPDTPPGTPPPISAGGLLPPEDPMQDQIMRDWEVDRRVRAAASVVFDENKLRDFIDKLPYETKDGTSRILMDAVAPEGDQQIAESQILIKAVSKETQKELKEFLIPLLKAHKTTRVTYATMQRKTLVTDVRITLEPRASSVTGNLGPEEKRFGKDHAFYGPSNDDVAKLVMHTPRTLSTQNKASYVSKPQVDHQPHQHADGEGIESPGTPNQQPGELDTPANDAPHENAVVNRRWRGMSVPSAIAVGKTAKLMGTMVAGAKNRVAAKFTNSKYSHEGTSCQFCKMSPIIGQRYSCATCVGFDLCENCYSLGGHGLENSDEMFYRVQELVLARCARLIDEVDLLELLRFEICRSNLRKFNFCLNWLADIINGKTSRDLQARALEIPSIRRDVRKRFVPLLMVVCSDRDDIEVKTEWELESDNSAEVHSVVRGSLSQGDGKFLETLRIWVADQYRTTSPFVERNLLKYREGGMALEEEDEEDEDLGGHGDKRTPEGSENGPTVHTPKGAPLSKKPPLAQKKSNKTLDQEEERSATSQQGFLERNHISSEEF
uniref:ZZ-type domain-containing protein n=1 Tax=Globisporangium ultimum (strain ATCC 200006 / CBS 805.95 / DAOM BR144) TaxID=431595 RepID=K3WXN6_GLOUD